MGATTIQVPAASSEPTSTGLTVAKGDWLAIQARGAIQLNSSFGWVWADGVRQTGLASSDPQFVFSGGVRNGTSCAGGLLYRFNTGDATIRDGWALAGRDFSAPAGGAGTLELLVNDILTDEYYSDNLWDYAVSVYVSSDTDFRLNWLDARAEAKAGAKLRRAGWTDKYIEWDAANYLWWLQPYNAVTKTLGLRRVVQAHDFLSADFRALDWTWQNVPGQATWRPVSGALPGVSPSVVWQ